MTTGLQCGRGRLVGTGMHKKRAIRVAYTNVLVRAMKESNNFNVRVWQNDLWLKLGDASEAAYKN